MTQAEAGQVVAYLNAVFPRDALEPESMTIWISEIAELPHYDAALAAAKRIGREGDRFPTVKEFRAAYRQALDRLTAGRELEAPIDAVPPPPEFTETWERLRNGGTLTRSLDDAPIPPTTAIRPRPVWARHLRREQMRALLPPSDEEKHDAILVLRDWCAMGPNEYVIGDAALVVIEAQRILDDAHHAA